MKNLKIAFATAACLLLAALGASTASAEFDILSFTGGTFNQNGTSAAQAGSHPYSATTTFMTPAAGLFSAEEAIKDVDVNLPPGFIANPSATPTRCTSAQLYEQLGDHCPSSAQVGTAFSYLAFGPNIALPQFFVGVYNMVAPPDSPALLGFTVGVQPIFIFPRLRSEGDYGVTAHVAEVSQLQPVVGATVTLWGVPGDPSHDTDRGTFPGGDPDGPGGEAPFAPEAIPCSGPNIDPLKKVLCKNAWPTNATKSAFLTNPSNCAAGPLATSVNITSWQHPDVVKTAKFDHDTNGNPMAVTGCDRVPFDPAITIAPTSHQADSPTGLDVNLTIPQDGLESPTGLAPAPLKRTTVTLPEGMGVNPSSANGQGACTAAQVDLHGRQGDNCPDSSKIGTVSVDTPLLDRPLEGSVYLAKQYDNPFNSLLAIYIAIDDPKTGIVVKLPGHIEPGPGGQLRTTFDDNPQVPFNSLELNIFGGPRAPLINPPSCGTHTATSQFSPWSAVDPDNPTPAEVVSQSSSFEITSGPNGGPCPSPTQFDPSFEAGTITPLAGAYSPLVVNASRPDGSQVLRGLNLDLPPGLSGKIAGTSYCPQAAIDAAAARSGQAELASPSCPAASLFTTLDVGAGAGPTPFHVPGRAYLAGPYKGAPLSVAVITPAVAGPFDLGTVVVRAAIGIDPQTAQVHVTSDPIPTILQGIPLHVRSVSIQTTGEHALNPTNCDPMSLGGTLFGSSVSKLVSNRFQVGACKALDFKPKLYLKLSGGTRRGDNPALTAVVDYAGNEANIKRASVALPHSEFLDQSHIGTVCTRVQYAADSCPAASVYGFARAFTPLLDQPLEGPVYLRSSDNPLPDLVASLHGQVDFELAGRIDSVNGGIRTTFATVPDAPVSKFVLKMPGGKKGLLVNSRNVCSHTYRATAKLTAHSGKRADQRPVLRSDCGKGGKRDARR